MARKVTLEQTFELALRYDQASDLQRAEAIYRQIIEKYPEHFEVVNRLVSEFQAIVADKGNATWDLDQRLFVDRDTIGVDPRQWASYMLAKRGNQERPKTLTVQYF